MKITVGIGATRANTIEAAARSICRQTWPDWELLVVGQGSEASAGPAADAAAARTRALVAAGKRLEGYDPRVKYIHLAEMGLSRARNEAICRAQGEVIAFIDDDCEADPDWLAVIADCLQSASFVGLVGGALIGAPANASGFRHRRGPGSSRPLPVSACPAMVPAEGLYDPAAGRDTVPRGWDWVGANVAMRAEVVAQVGLFDELLGPGAIFPSGEDTDYKLRAEAAGVCMLATPRAIVRHTFGRRVGLQAVARLSRSYARGAGAVAGKLTASGDPRGAAWVVAARQQFWRDLVKPGRAVAAIYRLPHFLRGYREVVAGYTVDARTGCLQPKPAQIDGSIWTRGRAPGSRRGGAQCGDSCE